jgi:phosphoribosylaminoimidazole-succinocarboxamide synthase
MEAQVVSLNLVRQPFRQILVKQVSVQKPSYVSILGRNLPDYSKTNQSPKPKLVPLEVVFRFECAEESSILGRSLRDPHYLASLGFPEFQAFVGAQWDFPVLELFTKLETTDRAVPLSEALAISGLSAEQLQEVLLKTAWVAGLMRFWMNRTGLHLADGKLEWAVSEEGQCFLVDAIGPDELRMMKAGTPLSKEFLRTYYRSTSWFAALEKGKAQARLQGISEWKRFVQEAPPALSPRFREVATQLYLALSNELTARRWFADAWSLDQVVRELQQIQSQGQGVEGLK